MGQNTDLHTHSANWLQPFVAVSRSQNEWDRMENAKLLRSTVKVMSDRYRIECCSFEGKVHPNEEFVKMFRRIITRKD